MSWPFNLLHAEITIIYQTSLTSECGLASPQTTASITMSIQSLANLQRFRPKEILQAFIKDKFMYSNHLGSMQEEKIRKFSFFTIRSKVEIMFEVKRGELIVAIIGAIFSPSNLALMFLAG